MPQFRYRGRNREGQLRSGQRFSNNEDSLNAELIKEGIYPIQITLSEEEKTGFKRDWFKGENFQRTEMAIFARQMELLQSANIPMVTALKQMANHTRSVRLSQAINGLIAHLEKGESLASAMQYYPGVFSPLIVNIIQIGESTGHLGQAFANIYQYLEFEVKTFKHLKSAFRYPLFVLISVVFAIVTLNVFVIPTFSQFYTRLNTALPWQTRLLMSISNAFVHYGLYMLIALIALSIYFYRYIQTPKGQYRWDKFKLHIPIIGKIVRRVILIRFCQSLAIVLGSGIALLQGLNLVKNIIVNQYIVQEINGMQEAIERGVSFTVAISQVELFTPLEIQILSVGEKGGNLTPALNYIANFHGHEIEYDVKRMSDLIGPIMIAIVSVLVLLIALGVYLPIWNMVNLIHA